MKIIYVISTNTDKLNGIGNKVVNQIKTWIDLGENTRALVFATVKGEAMASIPSCVLGMEPPASMALLRKPWRIFQFLKGHLFVFFWRPDIIYVRAAEKPRGSQLWEGLGAKIICEVNADIERQMEEDISTGVIDGKEAERRTSRWREGLESCDGVVSVSYQMDEVNQKFFSGKPHAVVWNSIKFDDAESIRRTNENNVLPTLCFIGAENFSWNGIDLLKDFAERTIGKLEFVVIGASDDSHYPSNARVYSYLENAQMLKVLAGCDVGMGTMALFRKGLNECSALKTRDYAKLGIPMLLAYKETPFVGKELPDWILEVENKVDTLVVNEAKIIEFAEKWKGESYDAELAKPFFDSYIVEKQRIEFFKDVRFQKA